MEIDAQLTNYIVVEGGDWGRGETIAKAMLARPFGKEVPLSKQAMVYRCTPETYINDDGRLVRTMGQPEPVLIDPKTGIPK